MKAAERSRGELVTEVVVLWLVTLLAIRVIVVLFRGVAWDVFLAAVPILFMYAPVWRMRARGEDPDVFPLALPAFEDRRAWLDAAALAALVAGLIAVPWVYLYDAWQTRWFPDIIAGACNLARGDAAGVGWSDTTIAWARELGMRGACRVRLPPASLQWIWPSEPIKLVGYHLFFVAIPEELFYRGYMQSRLDQAFPPRWRLLGAKVGPGWLLTCLLFAFGHSLVDVQWWHFAIFFPSLVFGWMRARTGGILAGAFFHAWSNVTVTTLDTLYGIVSP